jgi:nucleotide-binding universal stress UspA family protein
MEKKLLLAVDGSERGLEAVSVLGDILKHDKDLGLTVLHCVQQLASLLPGELCGEVEETCRLPYDQQQKVGHAVLDETRRRLLDVGFPENRIQLKAKLDSMDPGQDIMAEARESGIRSIALGRKGRNTLEGLLIGSVSSKVAQYAKDRTVWIVDTPVHRTRRVLVALEGGPDSRTLAQYAADHIAPIEGLKYTFLHLMPPVPPTFWDDGHILGPTEQKDRQSRIERWATEWIRKVEGFMSDAKDMLKERGVPERHIETRVETTREGVARDLLNDITSAEYQIVLMGKKSFHERKPFLLGSHANKVLQAVKGAILCLVDSQ